MTVLYSLFLADYLFFDLLTAEKCGIDMVAEILLANVFDESCLFHCVHRLFIYVREYYLDIVPLTALDDTHERFNTCGINSRNISHTYAEYLYICIIKYIFKLV